jgi:ParB/RepB/Spo0J family partition protein
MTEGLAQARTISRRAEAKGRKEVEKKTTRLQQLDVVYVPTADLRPNSYNPNRQSEHDFELLLRSIEEDGFTVPIVVRQESNVIVDGEHRWRACQVLGIAEIPVVYVSQSDEQAMVSTLRHNRARGSEDVELTAALLRDLQELGALEHAQDSLMLSDDEVALLIDNVAAPDVLAADDFGPAWEPGASVAQHAGETDRMAMTEGGALAVQQREAALAAAKTEEERRRAMEENRVYRISLVFSGDEADVVQSVLGDRPAVALLALCQQARSA